MLRNTKGFTLIELMVVILIIGILAALAIPKFTNASLKAKLSEAPTVLAAYESAQLARVAETGALDLEANLVFERPISKWFVYGDHAVTAGEYQASVGPNPIGVFVVGNLLGTVVSNASVITHAVTAARSDDAKKLLPNFGATVDW